MATIKKLSDLPEPTGYSFRNSNEPKLTDIFQLSILSGSSSIYRSAKLEYNDLKNYISDPIYDSIKYADPVTTTSGMVTFANQQQVTDGISDNLVISPVTLKGVIDSSVTPPASESVAGVIMIATSNDALNGFVADKAITPKTLNDVVNYATGDLSGMVEFATDAEATAGTLTDVVINPKQLMYNIGNIDDSSEGGRGLIMIADTGEVTTGTNNTKSITPKTLKQGVDAIPDSSEGGRGLIMIADTGEVTTGTNNTKSITPKTLKQGVDAIPDSSEGGRGLIMIADTGEVTTGTNNTKSITPKTLKQGIDNQDYALVGTNGVVKLAGASYTNPSETSKVVTPSHLNALTSYTHIIETQSVGVSSNTSLSATTWIDRDINSVEHNGIIGCTINTGTGEISLPTGSYRIDGYSKIGYNTSSVKHCLKFHNVGDNTDVVIGMPIEEANGSLAKINGEFIISSPKTFKLQHYSSVTMNGGDELNISLVPEIYCDLRIFKINSTI